ncbi:outer mitochondrial transmembrane helix translocase-like isoform X1 [Heterodontus francisci]|uniref:outer mitochondrial transmembrane helix translocase-like isoform X1 n=1 Tax=Heterodontus francisci TaxID=7792 RepID=UPI00355C5D5C
MNKLLKEMLADTPARPLSRSELLGMLFRLTIFGAATYFGIKWMVDTIDPTRRQKIKAKKRAEKLMKQIGVEGIKLSEYELTIAAHLVDPRALKVTWRDIAGLDEVITELQETVILPFQKKHLFHGSKLFQPPKGVLLYGPPGCGKTLIAKATASVAGCHFINMQASTLTDKWYGESQKLTAAVFSLAAKIEPCIIFIDEIDSFLRNRSCADHEATAMMKAQFMSLWDGLSTDIDCQVIVMGATNRPQDVDPAILRRMPSTFHVGLPRQRQRQEILKLILSGESLNSDVRLKEIAEKTEGYSGSDLRELCREAALHRLRDLVRKEQMQRIGRQLQLDDYEESSAFEGLRAITQMDLELALEKMKESKAGAGTQMLQDTPVD